MRGNRLREIRLEKKVSLEELVTRTGLKYRLLYSLDIGERPRTNIHNSQVIAAALGVTIAELWPLDTPDEPEASQAR